MKDSIEIVTDDDQDYVVIVKAFPVKSKRKANKSEAYLENELNNIGDVTRVSGHLAAARCSDGSIDIYEF